MGSIIGLSIGYIFGPVGMMLGLILGAGVDILFGFVPRILRGASRQERTSVVEEGIACMMADVVRAGGISKEAVLICKNLVLSSFSLSQAQTIMTNFKHFVENGVPASAYRDTLTTIALYLEHRSKQQVVIMLLSFLKIKNGFVLEELLTVQRIAYSIGLGEYEFYLLKEQLLSGASSSRSQGNYGLHTYREDDYYSTLELSSEASDDEVKKKYRELSKKYHPDLTEHLSSTEKEEADLKMRAINSAYQKIKELRQL